MTEQPGEVTTEQVRHGLAFVCRHFDEFTREFGAADPELQAVRLALRQGGDPAPALDRLHEKLRGAGDALGVYGADSRSGGAASSPGIASAPGDMGYVCESARCSRFVWLEDAAIPPVCMLTGGRLRLRRIG